MASRMTSRRFLSTLIHPLAVNVLDDIGRTLEVVPAGWVKCHGSGLEFLHSIVHRCIFNLSAQDGALGCCFTLLLLAALLIDMNRKLISGIFNFRCILSGCRRISLFKVAAKGIKQLHMITSNMTLYT